MTNSRIELEDGKYAIERNNSVLCFFRCYDDGKQETLTKLYPYSGVVLALVNEVERLRGIVASQEKAE